MTPFNEAVSQASMALEVKTEARIGFGCPIIPYTYSIE